MFILIAAARLSVDMAFAVEPDPRLVADVVADPVDAARFIEERGALLQKAQATIRRQSEELAAANEELAEKSATPSSVEDPAIAQQEALLKAAGFGDEVPADVAATMLGFSQPIPAAPVVANPCLGHAWIVGSLNDPNGYGPGGAFRCHSDTNPKSLKFVNRSDNYGFVVVINGLVVVPQTAGHPALLPTSGVPRELQAQIDAAGIGWLPMLPPGEILYGSSPSISGTWRLYRFLRDPVTGTYELDEACDTRSFDRHGYHVDWEEWLGDNVGYCD